MLGKWKEDTNQGQEGGIQPEVNDNLSVAAAILSGAAVGSSTGSLVASAGSLATTTGSMAASTGSFAVLAGPLASSAGSPLAGFAAESLVSASVSQVCTVVGQETVDIVNLATAEQFSSPPADEQLNFHLGDSLW